MLYEYNFSAEWDLVPPLCTHTPILCDITKRCYIRCCREQHHLELSGIINFCFHCFLCKFQAEGQPEPEIIWFKHQSPITQSDSVKVLSKYFLSENL